MSTRSAGHEVRVGLVAVVALGGLITLLVLAGDGPGFLTTRRQIEVDFRDGQGIRAGNTVRIAGIDAGRVTDVTLAEVEGSLRARITIAVPDDLAAKLKQDVKITIQASLTGQSRVNIISSGRSAVGLISGQVVQGVESSPFDPILQQVGLGPEERKDISHTIGQVREVVDAAAPRVKTILANVHDVTGGLKETIEAVRPSVEGTAGHVEDIFRRVNAAAPAVEASLAKLQSLVGRVDGILAENSESIRGTMSNVRDMTATVNDVLVKDRPMVEAIIANLDKTRFRVDNVLIKVDQIAEQALTIVVRNKADLQRTMANVRDATHWADKLVQKIFANPFVLSPFYKPTPEDVHVQAAYDSAQVFATGAKELFDAVATLEALQARPMTPENRAEIAAIEREVLRLTQQLDKTSQGISEALKPQHNNPRVRR